MKWQAATAVVVASAIMILLTFSAARIAWRETPDLPNFSVFAQPETHRLQSKETYLYSPLALQLVGAGIAAAVFARHRVTRTMLGPYSIQVFTVFWMLWTLALFGGEMFQVSHAMGAAGKLPPGPVELVENLFGGY